MQFTPTRRKNIRDLKPTTVITGAMVGTHAGTLTFVTYSIHASRCTLFLFSEWLNNIEFFVSRERMLDQIIEPGLWRFPVMLRRAPRRGSSSTILQPLSVIFSVWKPNTQTLTFPPSSEDHWYRALLPNGQ
jgi:hypothetical protein